MNLKEWIVKEVDKNLSAELADECEIPKPIANILVGREITTKHEALEFIEKPAKLIRSPAKLPDCSKAVARLKLAIENKEKIFVWGDYDVDGITSTSVIVTCFEMFGAKYIYKVPNRFDDGYDIKRHSVDECLKEKATLLLSVDCGIIAFDTAKYAKEKGIDLSKVAGSGDYGRIIKKDVDDFVSAPAAAVSAAPAVAKVVVSGQEGFTDTPLTSMRKTIARRLGDSIYTAPHFYLTMEICMDNAIKARTQMNEVSPSKISFQDMLIKACALSLKKHPAVNSSWMGDFIRTYDHVHIGSAIALPEGLIVPVLRFADQKSLSQISAESKELYDKARNKKIQPSDFSGNTFTISNLGMMDIDEFTAIINPPDSCILAVGKIKEVVVRKGDGFGTTQMMKVTLSCDHRSVDGAVGASFLQTLKKDMENPVVMLV